MNVHEKNEWRCRAGWALCLIAAGLILHFVPGCSGSPKFTADQAAQAASAAACAKHIAEEVEKGHSCPEAQTAIDAHATCHIAFPAGINLDCPEYRK